MPDLIDTIDALHAKATPGTWRKSDTGVCGTWGTVFHVTPQFTDRGSMRGVDADLIVAIVNAWTSIRDRLREAERERDEWKLASSKNGEAMTGYQSRAIVAETRNAELERKAKALDLIASGEVSVVRHPEHDGYSWVAARHRTCEWHDGPDLLTAIEAALAAKESQ